MSKVWFQSEFDRVDILQDALLVGDNIHPCDNPLHMQDAVGQAGTKEKDTSHEAEEPV